MMMRSCKWLTFIISPAISSYWPVANIGNKTINTAKRRRWTRTRQRLMTLLMRWCWAIRRPAAIPKVFIIFTRYLSYQPSSSLLLVNFKEEVQQEISIGLYLIFSLCSVLRLPTIRITFRSRRTWAEMDGWKLIQTLLNYLLIVNFSISGELSVPDDIHPVQVEQQRR